MTGRLAPLALAPRLTGNRQKSKNDFRTYRHSADATGPRAWYHLSGMGMYQPPDSVLVAIGAAYPSDDVRSVGHRLLRWANDNANRLASVGVSEDRRLWMEDELEGLGRMMSSSRAQKHDVALQMRELVGLMAEARGWLRTLRSAASISLTADTPALLRIASVEPELRCIYPRDFLQELRGRISALRDLAPRLSEVGIQRRFVQRGIRLYRQIQTAIGPQDLSPRDLELEIRRLYLRKGALVIELKRWARTGELLCPHQGEQWNLGPLDPVVPVPLM